MPRLIARRLLLAVPLVFAVSVIGFVLVDLTPGDAARALLGADATPQQVAQARAAMHLDEPLPAQYWHWLAAAFHGHFGRSLISGQQVTSAVASHLTVTLSLIVGAVLVAALVGLALGIASALRGGALGRGIDLVANLGFAIPNFWLALILASVFAVTLRLLPATGWVPPSMSVGGWLESLVLPVLALAAGGVTGIAKQTRDSMLDVLGREYIVTLRAAGLSQTRIVVLHALRNAAPPILTLVGLFVVALLGGTIVIEPIFALPGLGSLAVSSAGDHDLPMMQGIMVCFAVIVVAVNLVLDLLYGWLNPKARVA